MPRRYRRSRYPITRPLKSTKYSNETYGSVVTITNNTEDTYGRANIQLVPDIAGTLGTRKVKNFTLRLIPEETLDDDGSTQTFDRARIAWLLVYVPEGTNPSSVQFGTSSPALSVYEPNQNVIMSGLVDSNQCYSFKTRLARNLSAGDTIALILLDLNQPDAGHTITSVVTFEINYAISF